MQFGFNPLFAYEVCFGGIFDEVSCFTNEGLFT